MNKGLEALEKIDHTICLAFNENNNALFNKDKYEHIDCKDIDEFVDCYDIIEKELKALEIIKDRLIVKDKGGYIQVVCEFSIPSKSKKYDLLKEVLLCH